MRVLRSTPALLAGLWLCVSAPSAAAQAYAPDVAMTITLPNGSTHQLTAPESGLATLTLDGRQYGFRPTMHDDAGQRMTVTIFDLGGTEPVRELGAVEVRGGGAAVAARTSPAFKVQASRAAAGTAPTTTR